MQVRELELLGEDDVAGTATLSLMRLEALGKPIQPIPFEAELMRGLTRCGTISGRVCLQ
jgi:hypothetical protein